MITRERRGEIDWLHLHHGKANALDLEFLRALAEAFDDERAATSRALVMTGVGGIFSAGVDLRRLLAEPPQYLDDFLPALDRVFRTLLFFPKPSWRRSMATRSPAVAFWRVPAIGDWPRAVAAALASRSFSSVFPSPRQRWKRCAVFSLPPPSLRRS